MLKKLKPSLKGRKPLSATNSPDTEFQSRMALAAANFCA